MKLQQTVWVTNQGEALHTDRFDGEDVGFAPGEAVQLPVEVARFFFGYGDEDKLPALRRLGWIQNSSPEQLAQALERLDQFAITPHHPLHAPNRQVSAPAVPPVAAGGPAQAPAAKTGAAKKAVAPQPDKLQ